MWRAVLSVEPFDYETFGVDIIDQIVGILGEKFAYVLVSGSEDCQIIVV